MKHALTVALLMLAVASPALAQQGSQLLVVVGLSGDHENAERFHNWAVALVDAARERYGLPADGVVYLGEDPARDTKRIGGRATREAIAAAVDRLAARARPGDQVFIVLIGHGASATGGARFNLPGPDLTASEFAKLLDRFAAQQVVFVNTASASGGFMAPLSGRNRTVITATRTEGERNQTRFGGFFAEAFSTTDSDSDKDGRVSVLEAFTWACRRVAESYERGGQLLTEHAMLDDNGDGKGNDAPGRPGADGALARTIFMAAGAGAREAVDQSTDPELRELAARRSGIETRISTLKGSKDKMDAAQYEQELEQLLIELARTSRAIREKQKK